MEPGPELPDDYDVLMPSATETPTSSVLEPVVERRPTRRRRRPGRQAPRREPTGFPSPTASRVEARTDSGHSRSNESPGLPHAREDTTYAKPEASGDREYNVGSNGVSEPSLISSISRENEDLLKLMDPSEVEEAVEEIQAKLGPRLLQAFSVLRDRRSQGGADRAVAPDVSAVSDLLSKESGNTGKKESPLPSKGVAHGYALETEPEDPALAVPVSHAREAKPFAHETGLAAKIKEALQISDEDAMSPDEIEKTSWTRENMVEKVAVADALGGAVDKATESLGELAKWRFDLQGNRLSEEDSQALPTHLGLHHHGTQPDLAGYTMADIVMLARSSVTAQRSIAMTITARAVSRYEHAVVDPLLNSGGLQQILGEGPPGSTSSSGHLHFSNSLTYLSLVETLVVFEQKKTRRVDASQLLPEHVYYASRFYLPDGTGDPQPVLSCLISAECHTHVLSIASLALAHGNLDAALQALRVLSCFTDHSAQAAMDLATKASAKAQLQTLSLSGVDDLLREAIEQRAAFDATGGNEAEPRLQLRTQIALQGASILSACVVHAGWVGETDSTRTDKGICSDAILARSSSIVATVSGLTSNAMQHYASLRDYLLGALRILRAANTHGQGLADFSRCLNSLPALVETSLAIAASKEGAQPVRGGSSEDMLFATEVLLAIEAFVRSVVCYATTSPEKPQQGQCQREAGDRPVEIPEHLKERIRDLMPSALHALGVFGSSISQVCGQPRSGLWAPRMALLSAAAHMAATVLSLTEWRYFLRKDVLCAVEQGAEQLHREIRDKLSGNPMWLSEIALLCTAAHAAGRILRGQSISVALCTDMRATILDGTRKLEDESEDLPSPLQVATNRALVVCAVEWVELSFGQAATTPAAAQVLQLASHIHDVGMREEFVSSSMFHQRFLGTVRNENLGRLRDVVHEAMRRCSDAEGTQNANRVTLCLDDFWERFVAVGEGMRIVPDCIRAIDCFAESGALPYEDALRIILLGLGESTLLAVEQLGVEAEVLRFVHKGAAGLFRKHSTSVSGQILGEQGKSLFEAFQGLTKALLEHGPGGTETRCLSTLLLACLCDQRADESLRRSIWHRSVTDCGRRLLLYRYAQFPTDDSNLGSDIDCMVDVYGEVLALGDKRNGLAYAEDSGIRDALWRRLFHALDGVHGRRRARTVLSHVLEGEPGSRAIDHAAQSVLSDSPVDSTLRRNIRALLESRTTETT